MVRKVLLVCGIAALLVSVASDVLGGLRYEGYSFTGQAISELGAIGAPSRPLLLPLAVAYDLLALAFGLGVVLDAGDRNRRLRVAGLLLIGWVIIGSGTVWFPMHPRGQGNLAGDAPHLLSVAGALLLMFSAMGIGAFALGRRFRAYSIATLLTVILFGALTVPFASRIAAGQPTPGFGIIERINYYASLLWVAVLAMALLRRRGDAAQGSQP